MKTTSRYYIRQLAKTTVILIALGLSTLSPATGQTGKTDFSGQWTFNESKSNLAGGGFGIAKKLDIKQDGNNMTINRTIINRDGEERNYTNNYTLDGKENLNSFGRRTSKTTLNWSDDNKQLHFNTKNHIELNSGPRDSESVEVWSLGENGKMLNIDYLVKSPRGERHSTLVYNRK